MQNKKLKNLPQLSGAKYKYVCSQNIIDTDQKYIEELSCSKIIFHNDYTEEYKSRNIFPLSLENISRYEINEKSDEIMKRRYDKRVNHLSWCNHKILFDCCVKFIDGNKYFSYDEFDYKFLKLDEAFHSETYESTKLPFIYD